MAFIIWKTGVLSGVDYWPTAPNLGYDGLGDVMTWITLPVTPSKYWVQLMTEDDALWL